MGSQLLTVIAGALKRAPGALTTKLHRENGGPQCLTGAKTESFIQVETEEQLKGVRNLLLQDDGQFTFNKLVPQPEILKRTVAPANRIGKKGLYMYDDEGNMCQATPEEQEELKKIGFPSWYDWNLEKWGTQWEPVQTGILHEDECSIEVIFETPWSPPEPFYFKLQEYLGSLQSDECSMTWFYHVPEELMAGYLPY